MKTQLQDKEQDFYIWRKVKRSKTDRQKEEADNWLRLKVKTEDGGELFKGTALVFFHSDCNIYTVPSNK